MLGSLPPLTLNGVTVRIPLPSNIARSLTTALLLGEPPEAELRRCSALTIWALCASESWVQSPPSSWRELADGLQGRWPRLLDWRGEPRCVTASSQAQQRWLEWSVRDAIAAQLGEADAPATALLAQTWSARQWLASASGGATQREILAAAPKWFAAAEQSRLDKHKRARQAASQAKQQAAAFVAKRRPSGGQLLREIQLEWRESFDTGGESVAALAELAHHQRRLEQLSDSPSTEQLEAAKLSSLKELAYGASHELNNPLANISTRSQSLLRDEQDPQRRRALATIYSQALRAHEMISDMMLFANPPRLHPQRVSISELVRRVVLQLHDDAARQHTTLSFDVPSDDIEAEVDPAHFESAVRSLCWNALEALVEGGAVDVVLRVRDAAVEVAVSDNGPGITPAVREHIFDPFFSGREAGRGLGLGLCKCWAIAQQHGGSIAVAANEPSGTVVRLALPLSQTSPT